jgi:tetratricopeptide (TPR) repeat protein
MGSKLALLAAIQVVALALPSVARADNKKLARELFELGIQEYKAKDFPAAVLSMSKSYALDPQPNALYALAQAERLDDNCKDAKTHYEKLLETSTDEAINKAVKGNLELCAQIERGEKPKEETPAETKANEKRDAPIIEYKTVYRTRTERKTDVLAVSMFAVGGISLGGSVVTYVIARSTRNDANRAQTLDEYNNLFDRAKRLRWISYSAAGLGVALVGIATFRVVHGGGRKSTEVSLLPTSGGSMLALSGSF